MLFMQFSLSHLGAPSKVINNDGPGYIKIIVAMIVGHQPRKGSEIMNRSISSCLERQIERLLHYYYFCAIFYYIQNF